MPTGFQYACAETVEEATKVLNNAIRTARKFGVGVEVNLELERNSHEGSSFHVVETATILPSPSEEDDEEDLLG